jgi:hypothetical protein
MEQATTAQSPKKVEYYFYFEGKEKFTGFVLDQNGFLAHYVDGLLHHDNDEPAVTREKFQFKAFYKKGKLHRDNGPAIIHFEYRAYYVEGLRHRLEGPAVYYTGGLKEYWVNDVQIKHHVDAA